MADAAGRVGDQRVGELLGDLGGEERGVGIGELVELLVQRRGDGGMAVAEEETAAPPEASR